MVFGTFVFTSSCLSSGDGRGVGEDGARGQSA